MIIFDPAPQEHTKSPGWCSRVPVWETSWGTAMSRGPGSACSGLVELTKKKNKAPPPGWGHLSPSTMSRGDIRLVRVKSGHPHSSSALGRKYV